VEAIGIGTAGVLAATNRLARSAARTADGSGDLAAEAVEQISAKTAFSASLAVVRTGDAMLKRLLDIRV
jgi:flagellar hook protein FlgE